MPTLFELGLSDFVRIDFAHNRWLFAGTGANQAILSMSVKQLWRIKVSTTHSSINNVSFRRTLSSLIRVFFYSTALSVQQQMNQLIFALWVLILWQESVEAGNQWILLTTSRITLTGSDNGLSPGRHQAIIRNNAGILIIGPLGTNFSENGMGIYTFSFGKMHLKMSSGKLWPFWFGFNMLTWPWLNVTLG